MRPYLDIHVIYKVQKILHLNDECTQNCIQEGIYDLLIVCAVLSVSNVLQFLFKNIRTIIFYVCIQNVILLPIATWVCTISEFVTFQFHLLIVVNMYFAYSYQTYSVSFLFSVYSYFCSFLMMMIVSVCVWVYSWQYIFVKWNF